MGCVPAAIRYHGGTQRLDTPRQDRISHSCHESAGTVCALYIASPIGATYEEITTLLENRYGDHLAEVFHAQLMTKSPARR
jgi:hypothetical protein